MTAPILSQVCQKSIPEKIMQERHWLPVARYSGDHYSIRDRTMNDCDMDSEFVEELGMRISLESLSARRKELIVQPLGLHKPIGPGAPPLAERRAVIAQHHPVIPTGPSLRDARQRNPTTTEVSLILRHPVSIEPGGESLVRIPKDGSTQETENILR
jgi:hypothetical protein